jgi:hypothetical protein
VKVDTTEVDGVWILTKRWSLSYWPPKAWKPLSIREGRRGRSGRLGAVSLRRRPDPTQDPPFQVDRNRVLETLWTEDHPMLDQR